VWVMRLTGFMIPAVPLLWSIAPNPWYLLGVEAVSGFVWAGYSLSNFNLLLSLAPPAQRARYTAVYQVSVFTSAFIGPLLGSALAAVLGIRPLFWISAAGRMIASTLFLFTVRGDRESA
jgi:MFS transporter, DHA1 family, multidrug resistance protein